MKSSSAINIISWISVFSIAVATFALVVVLSAFNGLQQVVESMYEGFEPHINISPSRGKYMDVTEELAGTIRAVPGVVQMSGVVEELTLVKYGDEQLPCTMKGVEDGFVKTNKLDSALVSGNAELWLNKMPVAMVGYGMANSLSLYLDNLDNLKLFAPRLEGGMSIDPSTAFYSKSISPGGIFLINPEIDNKYLIVPISFARELLHLDNAVSDIEIKVADGMEENVKALLIEALGQDYLIESRFDLNPVIYKTNKSEKLVTFFILSFILIISTFNVISTLTMILLDKSNDIKTLGYLGFDKYSIRKIFISEGMLINGLGAGIGIVSGVTLCLLQQHVGLVRLEGGIIEYYPVKLLFSDFFIIIATVFTVGLIASYFPSRILIKGRHQDATLIEA
ncbi:MAG: ABC transporter permease [Vicingaceae bacterium]